nr:MAG TPA: hypothetical protein [Bacteriophage sp.]
MLENSQNRLLIYLNIPIIINVKKRNLLNI